MKLIDKIKLIPLHINGMLMSDPERNGEYKFLRKFIKTLSSEPMIFDVGSNIGDYTAEILKINSSSKINCFEPIPSTFNKLNNRGLPSNVRVNNIALSNDVSQKIMFEYGELYGVNSLHKHDQYFSANTKKVSINTTTIDSYCSQHNFKKIDFLKIDVEGHELNVLQGAKLMLEKNAINAIQFEYNYLWKNSGNKIESVFELLSEDYNIYRLTFWGKIRIKKFRKNLENYPPAANYVALQKISR